MMAAEVGVIRLTTPEAAENTMMMTAGLKPRETVRGPMIGIETPAMPDVDGIRKLRKKYRT